MKRIVAVLISVIVALSAFISASAEDDDFDYLREASAPLKGTQLNVYNWGEYIADGKDGAADVNAIFEEITGIKINYTTYDTNEDMYTKLKSGGTSYDIVIPSDYMIARLIEEDMVQKLDFSHIPHYSNILDEYKNLYFDPDNEYSVPYNVGMIGVIYDTTKVDPEDVGSWDLMWNSKYKGSILQYNNPRDAFATAQFLLGIDVNSTSTDDWDRAYSKLVEQKPLVQAYVADEVFSKMESGEAAIASYYVGDFLLMSEVNENLDFYFPKEGTNVFVDSVCIPNSAKNKTAAELYIDFLLTSEIALENAEYICYASPNRTVVENEDYSLKGNEYIYPTEEPITEYYHNFNSDMNNMMSDRWNSLKLEGSSNLSTYIGIGSVAALAVIWFIVVKIRKAKRNKYYEQV
ncbi:MAG: ABC transporter substrate-binding protein [Clostridia bacterium]|nr:ABC transporter substrate-binding protein [Clostridia bacterium]